MNPLKLRLPIPGRADPHQKVPSPANIRDWLATLSTHDTKASLLQASSLLVRLNLRPLPTTQRFETLQVIHPWVADVLPELQKKYREQSLPLSPKQQTLADEVYRLLDELAQGYKLVINDAVSNPDSDDMSPNTFQLALRQAIEQLGLLILESYAQFKTEPQGTWGELHRLYALAERNGLSTMAVETSNSNGEPLTTIQYTYLRIALLGLAQPYRLLAGQVDVLYRYLRTWTAGCRIVEKRNTLVEIGEIGVDLAGNRPPEIATSQTRFRPVDGRFLDISALRAQLDKICQADVDTATLTLAERLRRDLLLRLCLLWQGRGERTSERHPAPQSQVQMCIGLGAAHHQISGESAFTPEADENEYHRPTKHGESLSLAPKGHHDSQLMSGITALTAHGGDATRVSRFDTDSDVWNAVHDTQFHARVLRESATAGYAVETWQCINYSSGGVALQRCEGTRSQTRVGVLTAYRHEHDRHLWHVGIVRWLQINAQNQLALGIMSLGNHIAAVAVRAIGGTGAGGEYFRSLLIDLDSPSEKSAKGLLLPVSIYNTGTLLVINMKSELQYVRLTRIIETTSSFSLFAFSRIEMPPQEKARVQNLPQRA